MSKIVFSSLVLATALVTSACSSKPDKLPKLSVKGKAAWQLEGSLQLKIDVETEPGALVTIGLPKVQGLWDWKDAPKAKRSADSSGKVSLSLDIDQLIAKKLKASGKSSQALARHKLRRKVIEGIDGTKKPTITAQKPGQGIGDFQLSEGIAMAKKLSAVDQSLYCLHRDYCLVQGTYDGLGFAPGSQKEDLLLFQGQQSGSGKPLTPKVSSLLAGKDLAAFTARKHSLAQRLIDNVSSGEQIVLKDIKVKRKNGTEAAGELAVAKEVLVHWLAVELGAVSQGALAKDVAPTGKAVAHVFQEHDGSYLDAQIVGQANKLSDITYIAIHKRSRKQIGKCKGLRNTKTGAKVSVSKERSDLQVTLFARHTGKELAKKGFKGKKTVCPMVVGVSKGGGALALGEPNLKAAQKWAKQQAAKNPF